MIFWANVIVIHIDIYVRNDVTARFQEWYMHYWLILDGKLLESIKQCLIAWHIFIKEENHSKSRKKNYDLSLSWCLNKIKCFRLHALYAIHFSWNAIHIRPNCDDFFPNLRVYFPCSVVNFTFSSEDEKTSIFPILWLDWKTEITLAYPVNEEISKNFFTQDTISDIRIAVDSCNAVRKHSNNGKLLDMTYDEIVTNGWLFQSNARFLGLLRQE